LEEDSGNPNDTRDRVCTAVFADFHHGVRAAVPGVVVIVSNMKRFVARAVSEPIARFCSEAVASNADVEIFLCCATSQSNDGTLRPLIEKLATIER
jgi:hypothetical protein